ncbi:chloride channel [Calycina marina]|uniref:Chloride channel protein n=1 Tax=Calycina marina TaxID=1763456 RepID=A0A9P7Z8Y5_9HELO|nr:chloride channel [Calycina marina]
MHSCDGEHEHTPLLGLRVVRLNHQAGRLSTEHEDSRPIITSHVSKDEEPLGATAVGERLPYNDYTTIDWLHDLVKDSFRRRAIKDNRWRVAWDASQGWFAAALIGIFTACVAYLVDIGTSSLSDLKLGYCKSSYLSNREACCSEKRPLLSIGHESVKTCEAWMLWSGSHDTRFVVYVSFALLFAIIAGSVTMTTKSNLPAVQSDDDGHDQAPAVGKKIYMAAGSGIPEIKTILSGFVIPNFLDFKVLAVKAIGATFAVSTGMCLGKEGPFVHISTCAGYLVASLFPKYRNNGRNMREILSVACSAGLSVAFGAPIGGVLFSYEEISTYFPRKVMWRAFLCSLTAAVVLKALNPTGNGKLVLFETNYGVDYNPIHYLAFVLLGIVGGIFGGLFCKANYLWAIHFRKYSLIKNYPVFELALVAVVTALLQYPNPLTREPGDIIIKNLLVDCRSSATASQWVCEREAEADKTMYHFYLVYGTIVKLFLTIITFGCKVPSGVIIPALDAGALCGRLLGQLIQHNSPGIFAMVGAAAFLAGVSRMTVSLAVVMFELTGEVGYIPPFMIAILVAKWVADALSSEGVYDLAQTVLGHPFLDPDHALSLVRMTESLVEELIPPAQTMAEITVIIGPEGRVSKNLLSKKLSQLKARGLMDAGLVLVDEHHMLHGYLAQGELDFAISEAGALPDGDPVNLIHGPLAAFVDRTPLTISAKAPMEYAVEMFGKLGLRYLVVVEEGSSKVLGVIIKKRLVLYLEKLQH